MATTPINTNNVNAKPPADIWPFTTVTPIMHTSQNRITIPNKINTADTDVANGVAYAQTRLPEKKSSK